jgi:predicted Holliday junction resolvase-like endonuclease
MSVTLIIVLAVLALVLVLGTVALRRRRTRKTRQAKVEAEARRTEAGKRLEAAERERSIAEEQFARADRIDPDTE